MDMRGHHECVRAFADEQYEQCIRQALLILESEVYLELAQILLISLQRLGKVELVEQIGRDVLRVTNSRPWERSLLQLTLGQIAWPEVVFAATDPHQRCQAYYYAGARNLTEGATESAIQAFLACRSTEADCLEFELAERALRLLAPPGTGFPDNDKQAQRFRTAHEGVTGAALVLTPKGSLPLVISETDAQLGGWLNIPGPEGEGRAALVDSAQQPRAAEAEVIPEEPSRTWHSRTEIVRVFISSTFQDMYAEREVLVKKVFPELRRFCVSRGLDLVEVDLRWGISQERTKDVLPICFAEIENCQYFVALLGDRYGSLPGTVSNDTIKSHPWLKGYGDRSITELEILCNLFGPPMAAACSFCYFRRPEEGTKGLAGPQDRLKKHIRESGCTVRENYTSPDSVGREILEDLTAAIERDYPADHPQDPVLEQRAAHEAVAAAHLRGFVPRQGYTERLDQHIRTSDAPVMVVGNAGVGKSALLASWVRHHREAEPKDIVVEHYVGATATSADCTEILKRLMAEIKRRYRIDPKMAKHYEISDEEVDPGTVLNAFHNHLFLAMRLPQQRLVLVLDGLDQLSDTTAQNLWWLPERFTNNIKLILSARPGSSVAAARDRGWAVEELRQFTIDELSQAIVDYLRPYGKELGQEVIRRLVASPQVRQPLYLRVVLNELRVFGSHEELAACISHYLAAPDLITLYQKVFTRWQNDYNNPEFPTLVQEALSLLATSRNGLTENEWLDLLRGGQAPLPRANWTPFFLALQPHLIFGAGLWAFAQGAMSEAVGHVFLPTAEDRRGLHAQLAGYFAAAASDRRKLSEMPWHLQQCQDWDGLKKCLADLDLTERFLLDQRADELLGYWAVVGSASDMVDAYREALEGAEAKSLEPERLGVYCIHLADLCMSVSQLGEAESFYRRALRIGCSTLGIDHPSTAAVQTRLGRLLTRLGRPAEAEKMLRTALHAKERSLGPLHSSLSASLQALGEAYAVQAMWQLAEQCYERAFEICRFISGELHASTAACAVRLAMVLLRKGETDRAEEYCKRVLATNKQLPCKESSATRHAMDILAEIHRQKEEHGVAGTNQCT